MHEKNSHPRACQYVGDLVSAIKINFAHNSRQYIPYHPVFAVQREFTHSTKAMKTAQPKRLCRLSIFLQTLSYSLLRHGASVTDSVINTNPLIRIER